MNKIKILIVEDKQLIAESIAVLIEELGYDVVGMALDVAEAQNYLEKQHVDLALVDINLGDDLLDRSGIVLGELLKNKYKIPFIYLTGYSDPDTIIKAKKTQPQAYLTKPIRKEDLFANIEVAISEFVTFKDGYNKVRLLQRDILWVQANTNYVKIYTDPHKFYSAKITLGDMHQKLDQRYFLQIHKSYVINLNHISKFKNDMVTIAQQDFKIGRAYQKAVIEKLNEDIV